MAGNTTRDGNFALVLNIAYSQSLIGGNPGNSNLQDLSWYARK